jgi:glycosyltransferase involved in cell wall biosynthesis
MRENVRMAASKNETIRMGIGDVDKANVENTDLPDDTDAIPPWSGSNGHCSGDGVKGGIMPCNLLHCMENRSCMPLRVCHILFNTVGKLPPVFNELTSLSSRGCEAVVLEVMNRNESSAEALTLPGITIHRMVPGLGRLSSRQGRLLKLARFVEYFVRSTIFTLRQDCNVYVAHDLPAVLPGLIASRLRGRPLVYNAHELWSETNGMSAPFPTLWRRLERVVCPRVDAIIAPEANRARIYHEEYGAKALPVVAANCPPYREVSRGTALRDFLAGKGVNAETIVLYQGIFDPSRRLDRLVEAMRFLPETVALVIMGRGSEMQEKSIKEKIRSCMLDSRVIFHPFVAYSQLAEVTASADIGVLLYTNDCRNNFYCAPNKLYEYLHAGLPVVTSNFPGLSEIVEPLNLGACVDPEDPEKIAIGIRTLLDNDRRKEISKHAIRVSQEKFHWDLEFEKILTLYESLKTA